MYFDEINRYIQALQLPPGSFIITSGTVLGVLGIRPATDIDLTVSADVYKKLKEKGWPQKIWRGKRLLRHGVYDIGCESCFGEPLEEMLSDALLVGSLPCMNLERMNTLKRRLNRPKDWQDIVLIEQYQKVQSGLGLGARLSIMVTKSEYPA